MTEPAAGRPEEMINHYETLLTAAGNIATGLGTLASLWSTVVLLGGFVSVLQIKEFWLLTGLTILMACRVVDNIDKELINRGIYTQDIEIIRFIGRQKWIPAPVARCQQLWLGITGFLLKYIPLLCISVLALNVTPFLGLGVSVWRLVRRDYGDAGGDAANTAKLAAALDIFYVLVLFQSLFVIYWGLLYTQLEFSVLDVAQVTALQFGYEHWSPTVINMVKMYRSETRRKFKKDGELPGNWNLITYAVELLQSASGDDDHLRGARILERLFDKDASVRQELISSRVSIQNLIRMIGRRGTGTAGGDIENRECATRIIAHLASNLQITHFPGTVQCISSLLESCNQFCEACPSPEKNSDEQNRSLETSQRQDVAHMAVLIQDETHNVQVISSSSAGLSQIKPTTALDSFKKYIEFTFDDEAIEERGTVTYKSRGSKELISQGLLILERLTQDQVNCTEISRDQLLLYKITAALSSHDFLSNVWGDDTMVEMLGSSLTVVSRLLTCPGDGATRLRQELASTTEAVSNLMAILEADSGGPGGAAQELHGQALEILTELALDGSFKKLDFNKFFNALLRIFFEEAPSNYIIVEEANNIIVGKKSTRLRGKAAEGLARLLPIRTSRDVSVSQQEAINLLTKVLDEIISSKVGTSSDAADNIVENGPPEEPESVQPHTKGDENQPEETKFLADMLSLAAVICTQNVISAEDFARATPEDAALVKKLKEILKVNKHITTEGLKVVKLACQVVIAMIRAKRSCIQHFNEHNFRKELTEALRTMSEVDNCMLFAGNDREVIKPARSLASLVKEAQELLKTAPRTG